MAGSPPPSAPDATQNGGVLGMQASGTSVDVAGIDIVRFGDDGLTLQHWVILEVIGLMQQFGVVSAGPPG